MKPSTTAFPNTLGETRIVLFPALTARTNWISPNNRRSSCPIIVGEMLYQFRSALDHLFFDLVERNIGKGILLTRWDHHCQLPLMIDLPKGYTTPPVPRRGYDKVTRRALTDEAFAFIERIQPYYSSFDGRREPQLLRMLVKLSNIDKHRRLNTTILTVGQTQTAVTSEGKTSNGPSPPGWRVARRLNRSWGTPLR